MRFWSHAQNSKETLFTDYEVWRRILIPRPGFEAITFAVESSEQEANNVPVGSHLIAFTSP